MSEQIKVIPFPELDRLEVVEVIKVAYGDSPSKRKLARFWNRAIAFYSYVRDQAGAGDFPHPSGVRVCEARDRELLLWCVEAYDKRFPKKRIGRNFGVAWLDKGPSTDDRVPMGEIHLVIEKAFPNGLDYRRDS